MQPRDYAPRYRQPPPPFSNLSSPHAMTANPGTNNAQATIYYNNQGAIPDGEPMDVDEVEDAPAGAGDQTK